MFSSETGFSSEAGGLDSGRMIFASGVLGLITMLSALPGLAQERQNFRKTIVPTAQTVQTFWKYTMSEPDPDWKSPDFDEAGWEEGPGGFGSRQTPSAVVGTEWTGPDIWIRKTFDIPEASMLDAISLLLHHDEDVEVYVNGILVHQDTGYSLDYQPIVLDLQARNAFKVGENLLAAHCHQTVGGQFIDLGLETALSGIPTTLIPDSRDALQEWNYTTESPGTSAWISSLFNDSLWNVGTGGFGGGVLPATAPLGTSWTTDDIWLRKSFTLTDTGFTNVYVSIFHDEDAMVAINGTTVLQRVGYIKDYVDVDVTGVAKAVLHPGKNLIAVYCHQAAGGQFIDVGLKTVATEVPVGLGGFAGREENHGKGNRFASDDPIAVRLFRNASGKAFKADGSRIPAIPQ